MLLFVIIILNQKTVRKLINWFAKGFVRYYWLDTGNGEGASFSVFRDKAGADESVQLAADFVKTHLANVITQKPEVIEGPVKAHD